MNGKSLSLEVKTDCSLVERDVPSQRMLEIQVQAPPMAERKARQRLNLALVLDRSGSMSGQKLEYVKQAASHVVDLLNEQDQVALVTYDDHVSLVSPSLPVTDGNRCELKQYISQIHTGSMTNLAGGWMEGCQQAAQAAQDGMLNRVLLLTDGLANVGITDLEALSMHARQLAQRGVSTSTFGVGLDFNEHLLEAMANQGSGNFYFIEDSKDIPGLFQREFSELAAVTANEVEVQIGIPPHVNPQVLGGWRSETQAGALHIYLGSLFSEQTVKTYIRLLLPQADGAGSLDFPFLVTARGESGAVMEAQAQIAYQYGDAAAVKAAPVQKDLLERAAQVVLADTTIEALKLERAGKNEDARELLQAMIASNRPFLSEQQTENCDHLAQRMRRGMDERDRKSVHSLSYASRRSKG